MQWMLQVAVAVAVRTVDSKELAACSRRLAAVAVAVVVVLQRRQGLLRLMRHTPDCFRIQVLCNHLHHKQRRLVMLRLHFRQL